MSEPAAAPSRPDPRAWLASTLAVLAISTAAIAIRRAGEWSPAWIGAGRVATTALVLAPFVAPALREFWGQARAHAHLRTRVGLAAALLGAHFACWITSLEKTSVVTSVALVATQPLFAGLLGRVLGDAVPRRVYLGALVAIGGGVVMSGQLGSATGAALALAGAAFGAGYLAVGRSVRAQVSLEGWFVTVHALAAACLAAFALLSGAPRPGFGGEAWIFVLYLGLVPGVVGHGLINWSVRRVPLHFVAMMILFEPIGSGVLAWWLLDEVPGRRELVGGLIMLCGIGIGAYPERKRGTAANQSPEQR